MVSLNRPLDIPKEGDGIAFRDYLKEHYPDLSNQCVGRAELSKSYMLLSRLVLHCCV
jgi:hypothetical protein